MNRGIITLMTDFGSSFNYSGVMKGRILSIFPDAIIVDITHEIPSHDILSGALILDGVPDFFPRGTVHVGVVDPGVGGNRRGLILESSLGDYFVGPDNGLFSLYLDRVGLERAWSIEVNKLPGSKSEISSTFHGRDIFAPVAAYLASGMSPGRLGRVIDGIIRINFPDPVDSGDVIEIPVVSTDSFGNIITAMHGDECYNLMKEFPEAGLEAGGYKIRKIHATYSDVAKGELLALIGSTGWLELSVREGNAMDILGIRRGDSIKLVLPGRNIAKV